MAGEVGCWAIAGILFSPIAALAGAEEGAQAAPVQNAPRTELARRAADRFEKALVALDPLKGSSAQPEKWKEFVASGDAVRELGPEVVPHLGRLMRHQASQVRFWTICEIRYVKTGREGAVPALIEAMDDPDAAVRSQAAWSLGEMGPAGRAGYPRLVRAFRDPDDTVRSAASYAITRLGPPEEELSQLLGSLDHADPVVRRSAADALGMAGPRAASALPALQRLSDDNDVGVRSTAFRAVRMIRGQGFSLGRWVREESTPLHSFERYKGSYRLELVRQENGRFTCAVRRDDRVLYRWETHVQGAPFVIDGDTLYESRFSEGATGCSVVSVDLKDGRIRWQTGLVGVGPVSHSKYTNSGINMTLDGGALRIDGREDAGGYTEFLDLSTGKTLANFPVPDRGR